MHIAHEKRKFGIEKYSDPGFWSDFTICSNLLRTGNNSRMCKRKLNCLKNHHTRSHSTEGSIVILFSQYSIACRIFRD